MHDGSIPLYPRESLGGLAAEREIKNLLSTCSRARLAVAYWGSGAVARLGLDAVDTRTVDIEITCDLRSGACNPKEIDKLIKLFGPDRVRTRDGLHAKAWITDAGCVLGSSNASANGLGHEADETHGPHRGRTFPSQGCHSPRWPHGRDGTKADVYAQTLIL